jgi:uncharacterized membrane protein YeaQ/YmgE (transglycosylase-associated protein family)
MEQTVVISFQPVQVITWIIIGLIAGFFASILVRGRGMSAEGSILIGLIGALLGGFIFSLLNISVAQSLTEGVTLRYIDIIVSFFGAVVILLLVSVIYRRRG